MENIFSGKTVEDAIQNGLNALNITLADATITVIEEGKKGILGIGSKPAKVKIEVKNDNEEVVEKIEEVEEVKEICSCQGEDSTRAINFLTKLLSHMGIDAKFTAQETENLITITLSSESSSGLIGYRGEVLDSLQTLAGAIANKGREKYRRVIVDCEGYREKREETLKGLAQKLADKAVSKGRKIKLEPMNPFERRIIHSALSDREDIKTESEGKDPSRYIVIIPNNLSSRDRYSRRDNGKGRYNNDRKSAPRAKRTGFGATFLGNSLKDKQD
jgi:spoIIIJ-associated protein